MATESLRPESLRLFSVGPEDEVRDTMLRMLPDQETSEVINVARVRILEPKDLIRVLPWFADPETQGHLDPLPKLPQDPEDENQLMEAIKDLAVYYDNKGEPDKITATAAVNEKDKPLGVLTIRWRGDPWLPKGHKIASIERVVVNPKIRGKGVGTRLVEDALEKVFGEERDYPEVRAWVMSDERAGHWEENFRFFRKFGFIIMPGAKTWREYAEIRGLGENAENRDAIWLQLKKDKWEAEKKKRALATAAT